MNKKIKILIIMLISFVVTLSMGVTYSFFTSNTNLYASANVAKFVFEAKQIDNFELPLKELAPGTSKEYTFEVTNNSEKKQSNVTISYQITVKTFHFIPLEIKLYDQNNNLVLNCDESFTRNEENELVCNTEYFEMQYDKEIHDKYKLVIDFPKEYSGEEYASLVDFLSLNINSAQKVGE